MAGGIFRNQPFSPNPKCIVFGIALMAFYWLLPQKNPFLLPVIFVVAYVAMAWYDYMYDCRLKMYSGNVAGTTSTLQDWMKPQRRDPGYTERDPPPDNLVADPEKVYKKKVYALHFLFVAPLLGYVGWYGSKSNKHIWAVVGAVAILAFLYHGGRMFYPRLTTLCPEEGKAERENLLGLYILHVAVIAPVLAYVAWRGKNSDPRVWITLLSLAVLTFVYHAFRFFNPRTVKQCSTHNAPTEKLINKGRLKTYN